MTRRTTLFATLLVAALMTPALADPGHRSARDTSTANCSPTRMGDGMMHGNMHGGMTGNMMGNMHEMMAQMHGTPAGQSQGMMHGTTGIPGLESLAGGEFEVAFMSMMIAHHQGATTMADWALEHGDDPDVLAGARAIKAAQEPEIEQMTSWLREWYDADADAAWTRMMHADMSGMMTSMEQGADPDTAFLVEMIRHHQGAIDMAQLALERAEHEELRTLARDIILAQTDEVYQYRIWLDQVAQ